MIIFSTFLQAIASLLDMVINIYIWIIIISSLISWVRPDPNNPIVQLLSRLAEPSYVFVRKFIPTIFGGIDLAPLIIILSLQFINLFLVKLLYTLVASLNS